MNNRGKPSFKQQAKKMFVDYYAPPRPGSLKPTLPAEGFIGVTKEAYQAAREIPETLAQLPCYCHCDKSMGHKASIAVSKTITPVSFANVDAACPWSSVSHTLVWPCSENQTGRENAYRLPKR
jgi:hypothetical protein